MNKTIEISFGSISVNAHESDAALLQKARSHLPSALRTIGERMGEETWKTLESSFRGSLFKFSGNRSEHVRDAGNQYVRNASHSVREQVVQTIFEQLKQQRAAKEK